MGRAVSFWLANHYISLAHHFIVTLSSSLWRLQQACKTSYNHTRSIISASSVKWYYVPIISKKVARLVQIQATQLHQPVGQTGLHKGLASSRGIVVQEALLRSTLDGLEDFANAFHLCRPEQLQTNCRAAKECCYRPHSLLGALQPILHMKRVR